VQRALDRKQVLIEVVAHEQSLCIAGGSGDGETVNADARCQVPGRTKIVLATPCLTLAV
jgi:hypothetical protein